MSSAVSVPALSRSEESSIQQQIEEAIEDLSASLPNPHSLSSEERRGIIARYASVLEGNFIYWMTGTYLSVRSEAARSIILGNLREEIRDCHPGMMRRFAVAAGAVPTDSDASAVYRELTDVRLFVGRLPGVPLLLMMTFFEGFIQRYMASLAELALLEGSAELEYTDVHGLCDITHTEELFRAVASEMSSAPPDPETDLLEGVELLRLLIVRIVQPVAV